MTKNERLSIKMLPADKVLLERLAHVEGEAYAVLVRRMIRKAAAEAGLHELRQVATRPEILA